MIKHFILEDLDCAHCASKIESSIAKLEGVDSCTVTFLTKKLVINMVEEKADEITREAKKIVKKIEPDVNVIEK